MAVSAEKIKSLCDKITQEVEALYEGLSLHFIVHGTGKLREAIALSEHEIISHPAGKAARAIIKKHSKGERSSFLGIAIANEVKMMGLKKIDHLLGLLNINSDHFENEIEAQAQIFHLVWHVIDLYEIRQEPAYRRKFKTGPMVPKRSPLNLSKANLQADVFASILNVLKNRHSSNSDGKFDINLVKLVERQRGVMSLSAITDYKAEDFPSIIAIETCEFVLKELMEKPPAPSDYVQVARKVSLDVGHAYDEHNIRQWWDFAIPAQDMAWRGYTKEEILGAAVGTSNNPFVRSVAYLIQESIDITPVPATALSHSYNAFIDPIVNMKLHREMVDTIFDNAITQGTDESSAQALIDAANKQNENLTEGRILGWCANALQDAAKAFEKALRTGASPDQAARMQFEGNRNKPDWDTLKDLGDSIVDQRRQGFAVTMGHIAEVCHNNPAFAPVLDSIKITMNDPSYLQKLEASNDLAVAPVTPNMEPNAPTPNVPGLKGAAPKGPAPNTPLPNVPAPIPGPAFGGGSNNAAAMRHRQAMLQKQKEQQEGSGDKSQE